MALHNYFWLSQAEISYITVDSYHPCANPGVRLAQPIDRLVVGSSYTSHVPKLQCVGGEKKKSHVHTACACSVPQICSVTLISARYANFSRIQNACHRSHSVWTMTKERQRYSALCLQKLSMHSSIPAKHCSMWLMQSLPLKLTDHFKQSNADSHRRSNAAFDFKIARYVPQREYNPPVGS